MRPRRAGVVSDGHFLTSGSSRSGRSVCCQLGGGRLLEKGMTRRRVAGGSVALILVVLMGWYVTLTPPASGDWKPQFARLPTVAVDGDKLLIGDLRDFRYDADGAIREARYLAGEFRLSQLESTWFGLSHFGEHGLAHAFMAFRFSDGQHLAVSIEARQERSQPHYSPLAGTFRRYTKFMVLATEQDVIGLRSHVRKEPLFLYRLSLNQLQSHTLLLNFLRRADYLSASPDFYNTLTDNCLTGLMLESGRYEDLHSWLDYRILLPGYADEMLHEIGVLAHQGDIEAVRAEAQVPAQVSPEQPGFSDLIRRLPVGGAENEEGT